MIYEKEKYNLRESIRIALDALEFYSNHDSSKNEFKILTDRGAIAQSAIFQIKRHLDSIDKK
jgi:hypothetical protein